MMDNFNKSLYPLGGKRLFSTFSLSSLVRIGLVEEMPPSKKLETPIDMCLVVQSFKMIFLIKNSQSDTIRQFSLYIPFSNNSFLIKEAGWGNEKSENKNRVAVKDVSYFCNLLSAFSKIKYKSPYIISSPVNSLATSARISGSR